VPQYKRILVIRFSSLGDVILTSPFLRILRQKFPEAQIDFCTKTEYAEILKYNPNITNIIEADNDLNFGKLKILRKSRKENRYDLVIDLHNNLKTFYLKIFFRLHSKVLVFRKYSIRKFLLVKFKINLLKHFPPIYLRYINTLKKVTGLNGNDLKTLPEIFTGDNAKNKLITILRENGVTDISNIICIVPGSKHFTKTYPPEYFAELIKLMHNDRIKFILAGTKTDKTLIDEIISKSQGNVYDFSDRLNLLELAELMRISRLVISGDTGPMHIAEALNVPLIAVMGSSVREFGFYPASERSIVIENTGLSCRPCSHIGKEKCPKGHFKCMLEIKPEMVYNRINKSLFY
jgi:heptosyltransferase-2